MAATGSCPGTALSGPHRRDGGAGRSSSSAFRDARHLSQKARLRVPDRTIAAELRREPRSPGVDSRSDGDTYGSKRTGPADFLAGGRCAFVSLYAGAGARTDKIDACSGEQRAARLSPLPYTA